MNTAIDSPTPQETACVDPAAVATHPRVVATVEADGSGCLLVDAEEHRFQAADLPAARTQALRLVQLLVAAPLARPVRVDTREPGGAWQVIVLPDGAVRPSELDPSPTSEAVAAPIQPRATTRTPRTPRRSTTQAAPPLSPAPMPSMNPPVEPIKPMGATDTKQVTDTTDTKKPTVSSTITTPPRLADLIAHQPPRPPEPAQWGWRYRLRQATGGLVHPAPGLLEQSHRSAITAVQRTFTSPRTVVVVNPKGGAHKTTAALMLAATFGLHRGGYTLAWDNNETRGTMGWRAQPAGHQRTVMDLLRALPGLADGRQARVGDIDPFVRPQHWGHFDVLASDEDAASAAAVDAPAFDQLHAALGCFYRLMVVDTGNNIRAANWQAALAAADQLVLVSTVREDTSKTAAWLADALAETGHEDLVRQAVTVLTAPSRASDVALEDRLEAHFSGLTRAVVSVPHDPALVAGGPIDFARLSPATREAWLRAAAAVADGL